MYLVTGSKGQLGKELLKLYSAALAVDKEDLDISDREAVEKFDWSRIDVIFNAAAFTAVDAAETNQGKSTAQGVNADAVRYLATIAEQNDIILVHISTDYVFDGEKDGPYTETDEPNPINVYGKTKLAGDEAAAKAPKYYILRTSWVIGDGNNFVRTMLKLGKKKNNLNIVSDQIGRPTFAKDLAAAAKYLYESSAPFGLYNFSNTGRPVSWADFARTIFKMAEINCNVVDTVTDEYSKGKSPWAPRPLNSVLDLDKISKIGFKIRDWETALGDYLGKKLKK